MIIGVDIRALMEEQRSGVAQYLFNLLDNLFKTDTKNHYKLFYNSFKKTKKIPNWNYPNVKFYGFHWPNKILNFSFRFFHYPKVDKLVLGCDVFFLPNLCFISLSKDCKKIITVHDLSFEFYKEFLSFKKRLWHWFINPRKFFSQADRLIAVSENTKNDLVNLYGLSQNKVEVIYSGVKYEGTKTQNHKNNPLVQGKYILTLGTKEPRKNLVGLIQAFEKIREADNFKDWNLVIAGGSGWLNKKSNQLIKKSRFSKDIKVLSYVNDEEKASLYKNAQVFVYPSFYEGFGFPPLEAMSYGCPVIASLAGATSEICGEAAILVEPYKIEEMVLAIKELPARSATHSVAGGQITNYELRNDLVDRGYERVGRFNWQKTTEDTFNILASSI